MLARVHLSNVTGLARIINNYTGYSIKRMSWICPKCSLVNVNYNYYCADEKCRTRIFGPLEKDSFTELVEAVREYKFYLPCKLDSSEQYWLERLEKGRAAMTDAEQLFADFFTNGVKHAKGTVEVCRNRGDEREYIILELKAFRQTLVKSIVEAKAYAYAYQKEIEELEKDGKTVGFSSSINETSSSDALNAVKERQKRIKSDNQKKLSKQERLTKNMLAAGMDPEYVKKIMSPSHILAKLQEKKRAESEAKEPEASFPVITPPEQKKTINNPFKKKSE